MSILSSSGRSDCNLFVMGLHHGIKFKPMIFKAKRTEKAMMCACELTAGKPICNDSHEEVVGELPKLGSVLKKV